MPPLGMGNELEKIHPYFVLIVRTLMNPNQQGSQCVHEILTKIQYISTHYKALPTQIA